MSTIDFQLNCACCGAALHGLSVHDACAQCGQPVGDTISLAALDPVDMSVCIDLSCVGCDYNLRTLRFDAVCPECFKPVIESLRPDELRFATTKWLRRVRGGVTLLLVAAIGSVVMYFGVLALEILWAGLVGGQWGPTVAKVCGVLLLVLVGWGIFAATTSDPYPRGERPSNTARNVARCSLVLTLAAFLTSTSRAGWPVWINVVAPFMYLFLPVTLVCALVCVRRLARRARRRRLARLTSVLIWLFVGGGGGALGTCVLATLLRHSMVVRTLAATALGTSSATSPVTVTTTAPDSTGASAVDAAAAGGTGGADVATAPPALTTVAPPGYIATTVTVAPGGTVTTTTATAGPGVVAAMPTRGVIALPFAICGVGILFAGCYVIGLILLIKYRNLLGTSIAAAAAV